VIRRFDSDRPPAVTVVDGHSFLALCKRGPHPEQIHHTRYGTTCDCPCHHHQGVATHWHNGERA
jgi:hypothetical protein